MNQPPVARVEIPNHQNYRPEQEMIRLRQRVTDLIRLGAATPETFGQTIMQVFQETEHRRVTCLQEAEDFLRKYHALVAQAQGYAAQSSILYSVINGYVVLEERRAIETAERAKEQKEKEEEAKKLVPVMQESAPIVGPKNGRKKLKTSDAPTPTQK